MPKKNLGYCIVTKHGLISNILPALTLQEKLKLGAVCKRSYYVTLPWNMRVEFINCKANNKPESCIFPKIDDISAGHFLTSRNNTIIEGEVGRFIGSFDE